MAEHAVIDHETEHQDRKHHDGDRRGVPERDRQERQQHDRAAAAMQSQRNREQPAHGRIDAVEKTQPGERQPGPELCRHAAEISWSFRPNAKRESRNLWPPLYEYS